MAISFLLLPPPSCTHPAAVQGPPLLTSSFQEALRGRSGQCAFHRHQVPTQCPWGFGILLLFLDLETNSEEPRGILVSCTQEHKCLGCRSWGILMPKALCCKLGSSPFKCHLCHKLARWPQASHALILDSTPQICSVRTLILYSAVYKQGKINMKCFEVKHYINTK